MNTQNIANQIKSLGVRDSRIKNSDGYIRLQRLDDLEIEVDYILSGAYDEITA